MPKYSKLLYLVLTVCLSVCAFAQYDPNHFDPSNATHWYRKAFALYEEPEITGFRDYLSDEAELTPELLQYLKKQKPVVDLIIKASQVKDCDWQYDRYKDIWRGGNDYALDVVHHCVIVLAYTKYYENQFPFSQIMNNWKACFNSTQHINNPNSWDHWNYMMAKGVCFLSIQNYIYRHPEITVAHLTKINDLLMAEHARRHYSLNEMLDDQLKFAKTALTKHQDQNTDFGVQGKIVAFKGDAGWKEFFKNSLSYYEKHINSLRDALNTPIAFRYLMISQVEKNFEDNFDKFYSQYNNLPADFIPTEKDYDAFIKNCGYLFASINGDPLRIIYYVEMDSQTVENALLTGVSLLLEYHKSGQLPDNLPASSPKDAFGDQPFDLIKTDAGFTLKSRSMDVRKQEYPEYEFKLPKE